MRVKHWQGYGSVNVFKKEREVRSDGTVRLHLQVRGNHEWGIERNDVYDVVRWIGIKCDKQLTDYRQVCEMLTDNWWDSDKHEDVCDYYITYTKKT